MILLPTNDFSWSGWEDADEASLEIGGIIDRLRQGVPANTELYFLPTGPLQELSLSSGWGDEFIELANRYDAAVAMPGEEPNPSCSCRVHPSTSLEIVQDYGMDEDYSEVTLSRCPLCGQLWVRYFHENEGLSCSGRWYLGAVSEEQVLRLSALSAKGILEELPNYFYGGSRFGGRISSGSGRVR